MDLVQAMRVEEEVEANAMDRILQWTREQLNAAVDDLMREKLGGTLKIETCRRVVIWLGRAQLLGGEDIEDVTLYVSALLQECKSDLFPTGEEAAASTEQTAE